MQAREEAFRQEKEGAKEGGRLLTEYACGLIAFENNFSKNLFSDHLFVLFL